jgi:hypothetical protein
MALILSFRCPPEKMELLMDLLTGEGIHVTVSRSKDDQPGPSIKERLGSSRGGGTEDSPSKCRRKSTPHHVVPGQPLATQIYELLEAGPMRMDDLGRAVVLRQYALNSASSTVSRLLQAGFVTKQGDYVKRTNVPYDYSKIRYSPGSNTKLG